jgi:hypothetical protein
MPWQAFQRLLIPYQQQKLTRLLASFEASFSNGWIVYQLLFGSMFHLIRGRLR